MAPRWLPLESNPEVMNKYIHALGVDPRWEFTDVLGLDPELLCMIPQPVFALLLLFPITEKYETFRKEEEQKVSKEGQTMSPKVYFTKQTIGNACGTVGIIHSIANNQDRLQISDGHLKDFLETTKALSPDERAKALESCEGISVAHESTALEGQTEAPSVDDKTNLHFIALVERDGHLYELDGRKPFPINHGKTSAESFLQDAAKVCRKFMERDPDEINFNVVALASAS